MPFDANDPDAKAAIKAAVDEAMATANEKHDADIAGLKTKNGELLTANRDLKRGQEIKPEDMAAAEERADRAEAALTEASKQAKALTTERDKAVKALETEGGFTRKLLVENGLREALASHGVTDAIYQKAAMAMLSGGVEIVTDGDNRAAKVGDRALVDYVKGWAGTDEGKQFVSAPGNSGGGAPGGRPGAQDGKTMTRGQFDALDQGSRATFAKDGGKVLDEAA